MTPTRALSSPPASGRLVAAETARAHGRAAARGFTLVELMVAMTAGLLVSGAAMVLARGASRTFQQEARITSAQLAANLGMARLAADIQRASFMSSPHVKRDPFVCSDFVGWDDASVAGLNSLAGVRIVESGSVNDTANGNLGQSTDNSLSPDSIDISGTFSTTEQFAVRNIVKGANSYSVFLQIDSGAMARALVAEAEGGEPICGTAGSPGAPGIFRAGRFLRIADAQGRHEYGVITACATTLAGGFVNTVELTLSDTPVIPEKTNANTCGWSGLGTGLLVNPVTRVRYAIRNLRGHARLGTLVAPPSGAIEQAMSGDGHPTSSTEPGRTELIRVELAADGTEIEDPAEADATKSTLELVSEYAVDLKFGVISTVTNGPNPTVTRRAIGDSTGYAVATDITDAASRPNRIRGIAVRFSTRARTPDRDDVLTPGPVGGLRRFLLSGVPGELRYARMRTLQAEIALPNQAGVTWD
jgi:prepilin-type N-terminal cleavage/methylation domain-containing protein